VIAMPARIPPARIPPARIPPAFCRQQVLRPLVGTLLLAAVSLTLAEAPASPAGSALQR